MTGDRELAELHQQILREEIRHRKFSRDSFEQHEKIIGRKVRQLRAERSWTQADLARRLDELGWPLDQTTISNLELGRRPVRVAEADALAMAFGIPMPALWYLPIAGEPWSLTQMRARLQEIEERIAEQEKTTQSMISIWADYQFERERIARALNAAAEKAERGDLEEMSLDAGVLDALIEGLDPEHSRGGLAKMTDEELERAAAQLGMSPEEARERRERDAQHTEQLRVIESGALQRLASEAWQRHLAGDSVQIIAQALADSLPPETFAPLGPALDVIGRILIDACLLASGQQAADTATPPQDN